jgi:hypothetical protein
LTADEADDDRLEAVPEVDAADSRSTALRASLQSVTVEEVAPQAEETTLQASDFDFRLSTMRASMKAQKSAVEEVAQATPVAAPPLSAAELPSMETILEQLRPLLVKLTVDANRALPEDLLLFLKDWADKEVEARQSARQSVRRNTELQAQDIVGNLLALGHMEVSASLGSDEAGRRDSCADLKVVRVDSCIR